MDATTQTLITRLAKEESLTREHVTCEVHKLRQDLQAIDDHAAVLKSLAFREMRSREESVKDASKGTFNWIFAKSSNYAGAEWDSFLAWLQSGQNLYWINGKVGSGKSTLMVSRRRV